MKLAIECLLCKKLIEIPIENISDIDNSLSNIVKEKKVEMFELIINDCRDNRCVLYGYICKDCYEKLAKRNNTYNNNSRRKYRRYQPRSYNKERKAYKSRNKSYKRYRKYQTKQYYNNNVYIEPEYDAYYNDEEQQQ